LIGFVQAKDYGEDEMDGGGRGGLAGNMKGGKDAKGWGEFNFIYLCGIFLGIFF
jgi:hypothetical protein